LLPNIAISTLALNLMLEVYINFSGAQGEYAGLLCIMSYLKSIGQGHRNVSMQ